MNKPLTAAAALEIGTGLAMLAVPSLVARLLLGAELTGVALPVARVLGIALIALGVGCWPGRTPFGGMLTYNGLMGLYLLNLGLRGEWVGRLLWPAMALHTILTLVLARSSMSQRKAGPTQEREMASDQ